MTKFNHASKKHSPHREPTQTFRVKKKFQTIKAFQFDGNEQTKEELFNKFGQELNLQTGDWVCCDANGIFFTMTPEIFEARYVESSK